MGNYKALLTSFLLLATVMGFAQQNRYIVYFTDKNNTPFTLSSPEAYLSSRSIERRSRQDIVLNESDLPVDPEYLSAVKSITGEIYYPSKWLNAVLVQCSEEEIAQVEALSVVTGTELAAEGTRLPEGGRITKFEELQSKSGTTALNDFQLELHGIPTLHSEGYHGEGMMVAILDGGFSGIDTIPAFRHVFENNRILMAENIVSNTGNLRTSSHGTSVFSIMAAQLPDEYTGIIPDATYLLFVTEDVSTEQRVEEYNWIVAAEKADSAGVDVINTSLGYSDFDGTTMDYTYEDMDGVTAMISRGANWAAERGIIVVGSAGNSGNGGWNYITAPADAPGIIAVGAAHRYLQPASFSSFGPTFDGRVKPDVSSLGVGTVLIRSTGTVASGNGTSFAAPVIAGFVTLLWQQNPELSAEEIKTYIITLSTLRQNPNDQLGYGFPSVDNEVTGTEFDLEHSRVYPNPVKSGQLLHIQTSSPVLSLEVLSLEGRSLDVAYEQNGAEILVATTELRGVYILRVKTAERTHTFRVISK